jgi:dTDP-4-dehydrorhamnose reductase
MKKNILLTGGKGQLGTEIQEIAPHFPKFEFFPTDVDTLNICNKQEIERFIADNSIDVIINCAAYTAVDKAESDAEKCYAINRDAVKNLAEAAKGKAKIIHISTDYVFDGQGNSPLKETDAVNPQSVYGKSKLAGEQALQAILPNDSVIIRTAWLYSSFGNNFVKTMIRLGRERSNLNVVCDQFGSPTNAADLADAILRITDSITLSDTVSNNNIFHYTNEGITTWYNFTLKIHELAGITTCRVNPVPTSEYPTAAKRPQYSVLDKTKIKTVFGIKIPAWEESLKKLLVS